MKKEDLTEEQNKKLNKLKRKVLMKGSLAVFLYVTWLLFANILTVMFNMMYFHSEQFVFFLTLGSAVVIMAGLKGTIDEIGRDAEEEMKKIIGESKK